MTAMRVLLHAVFFISAFAVEMKVRAAQQVRLPKAREIIQLPAKCLEAKSAGCAASTRAGERFVLILGESRITLGSQTAVLMDDERRLRLVKGMLWIEAGSAVSIASEFGEARIEKGEFWLAKTHDRVTVTAIEGEVELRPRGAQQGIFVPAGLENYMSRVRSDGIAGTGGPVPLNSRFHIKRWARLFDGTPAEFKEKVMAFQEKWREAARQSAEIHQQLLARKVASLEAEHVARENQRRKVEARNRELVEMLRRRVFGEF
jgi:hypothetical protein